MKKLLIFLLGTAMLVTLFFVIRGAYTAYLKDKCINVSGISTTFNQLIEQQKYGSVYYTGEEENANQFLDIVFNSRIVGLDKSITEQVISNSKTLYEHNFSGGEYWVQKVAKPTRPVLFYYTLFDYENTLVLMVAYSIQSEKTKQTYDYIALYEYADVYPQQIRELSIN